MNIVKSAQRFDNLRMRLVFLQLCGAYRNCNRINAESGIDICGICLNIIYAKSELADSCHKVLKVALVLEFQMNFKMI